MKKSIIKSAAKSTPASESLSKNFFKSTFRVAKKPVRADARAGTSVAPKSAPLLPPKETIDLPKKTESPVLTINALQEEIHNKIMMIIRMYYENVPREDLYDLIVHNIKTILVANHNSFCFNFNCKGNCGNIDTITRLFAEVIRALLNKFFDYIINISTNYRIAWLAHALLWHKINIDMSNAIYDVFTKFIIDGARGRA